MLLCYLDEYRVELNDNKYDFLGFEQPKMLNYLNFRDEPVTVRNEKNHQFVIIFSLSNNVYIQKRVVYNIFTMFGDVGGLNSLLFFSM